MFTQGPSDVREAAPKPPCFKIVKVEVVVEGDSLVVYGVYDDRSSPELATSAYTPAQRVDEQVATELVPLFRSVQGQTCEHDDRDRVRHTAAEPRRRRRVCHRPHSERVVADDSLATAQDISGGCPRPAGDVCRPCEPLVQFRAAAIETRDLVVVIERLDRA